MTLKALIVMLSTWGIVTWFTVRYFWFVLKKPTRDSNTE